MTLVHAIDSPSRIAGADSNYVGRVRGRVIDVSIDAITRPMAKRVLLGWASSRESRFVCFCNVHSVVTARADPHYGAVIERADIAIPDGAPVAWTLRMKRLNVPERICGPDLMWDLLREAEATDIAVGLYGSTSETLAQLQARLKHEFPRLKLVYSASPPFRALSTDEDDAAVNEMNSAGVRLLFVGLGCPKQEIWMAEHCGRVSAVMLGVGAAFDFHAGSVTRAPEWMRRCGLEWLYRLLSEPRRLLGRYFSTNSAFALYTAREYLVAQFNRCRRLFVRRPG